MDEGNGGIDPQEFFRRHVPQALGPDGKPLSIIEQARLLSEDASTDQVRAILLLASSLGDALETDAILSEISQRTRRRFKVATLRAILKSIHGESRHLAVRPSWIDAVIKDKDGAPVPMAANVLTVFRQADEWRGVLGFDEFHYRPMLLRKPPWANGHWHGACEFADADEARALVWMQEAGIHCRIEAVRQALSIAIDDNRFHPVRDYLDSLTWDKKPRLDNWLTYYLGVEPIINYTAPVGSRWMISAVARIYEPGCMAKYCLILEGPQDLGKSAALDILGSPWYTDDIAQLGTKDAQMQVGNAWIVELSELDSMYRAEINATKAFISRKIDQFRRPFGRYVVRQPRQSVMAGTVNPLSEYLGDETGAVRFWPVECTSIDLSALRDDRDQLFAEARDRYRTKEKWWLDVEEQITAAAEEQSERTVTDAWESHIRKWLAGNAVTTITAADVLTSVFDIPARDHDKKATTRVGIILLRRLKWARRRGRQKGDIVRWYEKPEV